MGVIYFKSTPEIVGGYKIVILFNSPPDIGGDQGVVL